MLEGGGAYGTGPGRQAARGREHGEGREGHVKVLLLAPDKQMS